jgi:hypothetical protein
MQPDNLHILKVLWRKGTSQAMRKNPALDPAYLNLMEFDPADWLLFANNFARLIPFFPAGTSKVTVENWQLFFRDLLQPNQDLPPKGTPAYEQLRRSIHSKLDGFSKEGILAPQLTLFVAFLELLENSRYRLNNISKRHLDFYYSDVLRFSKLPAVPDSAFLIIESGKGPRPFLPAGTAFNGGTDASGKNLTYTSVNDFAPNLAQVSQLKNRIVASAQKKIKISQVANSLDGQGEAFKEENQGWWPFGHTLSNASYPELQNASFGFGIALPSLGAVAGDKSYSFELTFKKNLPFSGSPTDIHQLFSAQYSGENGWENISPSDDTKTGFSCGISGNQLTIVLVLNKSMPAIVGQQVKIHGDSKGEGVPLIWFDISCNSPKAFDWIKGLGETPLRKITIRSSYNNINTPQLESDLGILNPEKPFQPFGSIPKKGSSFYIKYPDWDKKKPTKVTIQGKWSNTPADFKDWYYGYRDLGGQYLSKDNYFSQHFVANISLAKPIKSFLLQPTGFKDPLMKNKIKVNPTPDNLIVKNNSHFKASLSLNGGQGWFTRIEEEILFEADGDGFKTTFTILPETGKHHLDLSEGIKITLLQSFLAELYPRLYALAMSSDQPETPIPNEPYTPLLETLQLNFETEDTFDWSVNTDAPLQFLVRDDFGWYEEQSTIAEGQSAVLGNEMYALSFPGKISELFIGISALAPLEQLSILFQVLEGSENPAKSGDIENNGLKWSVLVSNYWKPLERENIVSDQTDNLLKSGIIVFSLPEDAFLPRHRMDSNLIWIRLQSSADFDASSRILGVFSQAIKVVLLNDENDLSHLKDGLPAESIAKMIERKAGIKGILQPYNSFGGRAPEQDINYYVRASERLRHKNRAVSIWDIEHLVLQEFPDVYKVKCLNHTSETSFLSPGQVMVLVIPDTVNKNVYDIFQPTFSVSRLNEITAFLKERAAPQVSIKVVNPLYEEIKVKVQVSFYSGMDKSFYMNELNKDIITFLSPWTSGEKQTIDFNTHFNKSSFVYFFEKLAYVDFVQEPKIYRNGIEMGNDILPSSPKHILVAAKSHDISMYAPVTS